MPEMWRKRFKVKDLTKAVVAPPSGILHIWQWFQEIAMGRSEGFSGPGPITYPDIHAWAVLMGFRPSPFETRMILLLDSTWRAEIGRLQRMKNPKGHGN